MLGLHSVNRMRMPAPLVQRVCPQDKLQARLIQDISKLSACAPALVHEPCPYVIGDFSPQQRVIKKREHETPKKSAGGASATT